MAKFLTYKNIAVRISEISDIEVRSQGEYGVVRLDTAGRKEPLLLVDKGVFLSVSDAIEILAMVEFNDSNSVEWDDVLKDFTGNNN